MSCSPWKLAAFLAIFPGRKRNPQGGLIAGVVSPDHVWQQSRLTLHAASIPRIVISNGGSPF